MVTLSLLGREAIDYKSIAGQMKLGGVLVTGLGAVLAGALAPPSGQGGRNPVMGNVYLALECLGGALFPIAQKPLLAHYAPVTIAAWSHLAGAGLTLAAALPVAVDLRWALDGPTAGCLAYGVIVTSSVCLAVICWANGRTSPLVVTSFFPLQTGMSALLSATAFGYTLGAHDFAGMVCVALGIALVVGASAAPESWRKHAVLQEQV
jgi:drug/metabolite transporter (DMT)-like permease